MTERGLEPAATLAGVTHTYGPAASPALDGAGLEVAPGEIVALVGPNGAGKSTLLRVLAGELRPGAGEVHVPGREPSGRRSLGYAPDEGAHFEPLSGALNATFFARAAGLGRDEAAAAVGRLLDELALTPAASERVSTYSFGQRRKLLLLEAMVHAPRLLLLDEPTAGLDQAARESLARMLRRAAGEGAAIVLASHDLAVVGELADRVVFVHHGRTVAGGRPADLLARLGEATRIEFVLDGPAPALPERLAEGVRVVLRDDGDPLLVESSRGQAVLPEVAAALLSAGAHIRSVAVRDPGLGEAFRRATGAELGRVASPPDAPRSTRDG